MLAADGVAADATERTGDPTTLALAEVDAAGAATYRFYTEGTSAPGLAAAAGRGARRAARRHAGAGAGADGDRGRGADRAARRAGAGDARPEHPHGGDHGRGGLPGAARPRAAARRRGQGLRRGSRLARARRVAARARAGGHARHPRRGGRDGARRRSGRSRSPRRGSRSSDTIGAGDTFGAGWLAWWTEHGLGMGGLADRDAVAEATAFACRAAAITCSRAGADPPRRDELG